MISWVQERRQRKEFGRKNSKFCWEKLRERQLGRPRLRWEDNIKMDLQEVGCGGMEWI
jgi:hypothetical protein